MSEQAISQRIARGAFPEPLAITGRNRVYLRREVDRFIVDVVIAKRVAELQGHIPKVAALISGDGDESSIQRALDELKRELTLLRVPDPGLR